MDCKTFQSELPELVLNPAAATNVAAVDHMTTCPPCEEDYTSLMETVSAMDAWTAPEPSAYFDQRMAVLLREERAAPKLGFFARLRDHVLFNTGRQFRPAVAGGMALLLILGGGSYTSISRLNHANTPQVSATVEDLQILDRDETTLQQMDQLLQDDDPNDDSNAPS
jgi:hypothetical protein